MKRKLSHALLTLLFAPLCVWAQQEDTVKSGRVWVKHTFGEYPRHHKGVYPSWGGNGALLSFANVKNNNDHVRNIPRFTLFFNVGTNFNYDLGNSFGLFTGINIKNIGLITKENDSIKLKRRVYTLGVPIGFKIGDVKKGRFFFFGGAECDLAFNYKEKQFQDGMKKKKFNEWFSDRTPLLMPSVFAGIRAYPGFGLKVQYYLNDFFNHDFTQTVGGAKVKPYEQLEAKLLFVTLSYDFGRIDYHKDKKRHKHGFRYKSTRDKKGRHTEVEINY